MADGRRLTGCAASDHPDAAAAVGEVVGYLENALAGSPQFALVLLNEAVGPRQSAIAGAVHRLLGPDLLLAVVAPTVAGADRLAAGRASVVVWAIGGIEVEVGDDGEAGQAVTGGSPKPLTFDRRPDGRVAAGFRAGADTPRPMVVSGDGRVRRTTRPVVRWPPGSAEIVTGSGGRSLGPAMVVTEARGRTLRRLDHVAVRAVLVDRLETTDPFVDGPSVEFPPLRAVIRRPTDAAGVHRTVDVVAVDPDDGAVELDDGVEVGDEVRLVAADPDAAVSAVAERIFATGIHDHHRAVLIDSEMPSAHVDGYDDPIATAVVDGTTTPSRVFGRPTPWRDASALVVSVADEF